MRPLFGLLALVVIATGCNRTGCPQAALPVIAPAEFHCKWTSQDIQVDGLLDEEVWSKADPVPLPFILVPKTPPAVIPSTTVRMLWDAETLYVGIECEDDDIWSYSDQDDEILWYGDVAELFIKPSTDDLSYVEFVAAPNGALFDAVHPSRGAGGFRRARTWSSNARIATRMDGTDGDWSDADKGYTVEMAIPLRAFSPAPVPACGTVWTFGAFRYDYSKSFKKQLLLMSIPEAVHDGFHYYEGYHRLVFSKPERP